MVFVVASHTMVVEANANPDGTLKRKPVLNLPKSDLRGKWQKEDPRLAVVPGGEGLRHGGYTVTSKSTSVRSREDHQGGNAVKFRNLLSEAGPQVESIAWNNPLASRSHSVGRRGAPSRADLLLSSRIDDDDVGYYEPLSTITEKFKSVIERRPTVGKPPPAPSRQYSVSSHVQKPIGGAIAYEPIHAKTFGRPSALRAPSRPITRDIAPSSSSALVPFTQRLTRTYPDHRVIESDSSEIINRPLSRSSQSQVNPRIGASVPAYFRGMPLSAATYDTDFKEYVLPARNYESYLTQPKREYSRPVNYPPGFLRDRRYSLPARPVSLDMDTSDTDDLFSYRRRQPTPKISSLSYRPTTPVHVSTVRRSPSLSRYSRAADIEARLESMIIPDQYSSYAGLRSRAADARNKMDHHRVLLDRYLPVRLGPEPEVGYEVEQKYDELAARYTRMPQLERHRPAVHSTPMPTYTPSYRPAPVSTGRRMSLPSTPTKVERAPPRRPPMSDARKRAREVLCKTKGDPGYYDY